MELVEVRKKGIYCDSSLVAKKLGQKHKEVVRRIVKLREDLTGVSNPPELPTIEKRNYRGRDYDAYIMNREFFSLLAMRFQGKKALEWQIKFNNAFYSMEKLLITETNNKQSDLWFAERNKGKQIRLETTDVIKEFVEYATANGSKSAKFYYKHITNATYKALGLLIQSKPKVRDTLGMMETCNLSTAEYMLQRSMRKHMKDNIPYKVLYKMLVEDLDRFASSLFIGGGVDK